MSKIPLTVARTPSEAKAVLLAMSKQPVVAIDTETSPPDAARAKVVVWSASWGDNRICIYGSQLHLFEQWFSDPRAKKALHNAKYDIRVLENDQQRLKVRGFHADTMIMSWLVDENRRHGLKERTREDVGFFMRDFEDVFGVIPPGKAKRVIPDLWDVLKTDPAKLESYASLDAWATMKLYKLYKEELEKLGLWDYYLKTELPYTRVLMRMEDRGIRIDLPYMEDVSRAVTRHAAMLKRRIRQRAVEETGDHRWLTLNPRSPKLKDLIFKELGWPVLAQTEKGNPSLSGDELEQYAEHEPLAKFLTEYRGADKLNSGFVVPIVTSARYDPENRVSTDINQIGAVTGRVSSRKQTAYVETTGKVEKIGLNLQNVPAREKKDPYSIRSAFIASPGKLIVAADYSQIELRLIAHASQDKVMLDAYNGTPEKDLHIITSCAIAKHILSKREAKLCIEPDWANPNAIKVWKASYDESLRSPYAKPVNFGLNYGMQAYTLSHRLDVEEAVAQAIIDAYFERYQGVADYIAKQIAFALQHGWVKTLAGRRRRLPEINSEDFGQQKHAERQAVNVPIQGGAADVIKRAQIKIDQDADLRKMGYTMLIQVHDELVGEAPEKHAEEACHRVKEIMASVRDDFGITVPIPASGGVARSWSEAKS